MSFLKKFIIFFKICIGNAKKQSYNAKYKLHIFRVAVLLTAIAIAASSSVVECNASGFSEGDEPIEIGLWSLLSSGGTVELSLSVMGGSPICGMRAVIRYDSDAVVFREVASSSELADMGGILSFVDREGEIVIVIDAFENYTGGEIGVLVFDISELCAGREICFEVQVESLYFWSGDELVAAALPQKKELLVAIPDHSIDSDSFGLTVEASVDGEFVDLTLGAIAPSRCFAAGFDVYVVDIASLESQRFSVLSVLGGDAAEERAFSHAISLSLNKGYCVIIKPVAYLGNRSVTGREIVIVIDNGLVISRSARIGK